MSSNWIALNVWAINYHDINKEIGFGKDKRTLSWWTHIKVANNMLTMEDIKQHLALVYPDWGERNAFTLMKLSKGEYSTFVSGKAEWQMSDITGQDFKGGGFQMRFRDFDPKWIVGEAVRLPDDFAPKNKK